MRAFGDAPRVVQYYCTVCRCLWRKTGNAWSLWDAKQKPCRVCNNSPQFAAVVRPVP